MEISVLVICGWSDGASRPMTFPAGTTVSSAASQAGAPSGCTFSVNGVTVSGNQTLGNGDTLIASKGKVDAG